MSKSATPKPPPPRGAKKFGTSTWIALGLVFPALAVAGYFGQKWNVTRVKVGKQEAEFQTLQSRNEVLSKVYEVLQNKKFQVCNRSQDSLTVHWVASVYHDGRQLKVFDSSRCSAWKDVVLAAGDNRTLTLTSGQQGCNWNGTVVYFAMRYTRESEDVIRPYNFVGHWAGFDRDCFTLE